MSASIRNVTKDLIVRSKTKQIESASEVEIVALTAQKYLDLIDKIAEHQSNPEADLCSIGELVLTETGMWM
jgi:hypothetical protein